MSKITKPSLPKDNDFIHQYGGGGIPQYGTKNASLSNQNAETFQRHMASLETQKTGAPPKVPMQDKVNAMNQIQNTHPELVKPMQAPAPENFGPPKITPADADHVTHFGAPGFHSEKGSVKENFGPPKGQVQDQVNSLKKASQKNITSQKEQIQNQTLVKAPKNLAHQTPGSSNSSLQKSGGSSKSKQKKADYKSIEKMEVNNMLHNAMSHMKLSDPDPQAWN